MPVIPYDTEQYTAGRRVAKLSGALLGYMHNNVRGAYYGYRFAGRAHALRNPGNKSLTIMPPRKRRAPSSISRAIQRRRTSLVVYRPMTPVSNRSSVVSFRRRASTVLPNDSISRRGSVTSRRSAITAVSRGTGSNVNAPVQRRRGYKVQREGKKKRPVRVSRNLRLKIKKVISGTKPFGWFKEIKTTRIPLSDEQTVSSLGNVSSTGTAFYFDPGYVNYATSILFNQAPVAQNPNPQATAHFDTKTFKVNVLKQHVMLRFVNRTARNLTLKIYNMSPKKKLPNNGFSTPSAFWAGTLSTDATGTTAGGKINPFGNTINTLYMDPTMNDSMQANFTFDTFIVTLEPGKEYSHKITGPSREYNYGKFWQGGTFEPGQSFIKMCMVIAYNDIVGTDGGVGPQGTVGRYTDITNTAQWGLFVEQMIYTKMEVPPQTGFSYPGGTPAAGTNQNLDKIRPVYAIQNWWSPQVGNVHTLNDENPQGEVVFPGSSAI